MYLEHRIVTTTHLYDDPDYPDRVTSSVSSPAYVVEDRALLAALARYEEAHCRCGQPKAVAWHGDMDGWLESRSFVCHGCSALEGRQVVYGVVVDTRPPTKRDLAPFQLGVTTTPPESSTPRGRGPTDGSLA